MNERITAMAEAAETLGQVAREPIKEAVKEAMQELDDETAPVGAEANAATPDKDSGRLLVRTGLLATGAVIGYVIASQHTKQTQPIDVVKEKTPLGTEESAGRSPRDQQPGGGAAAEAIPRPDSENEASAPAAEE